MRYKILIIVLIVIFFQSNIYATIINVSDINDIETAMINLKSNDTILVEEGIYILDCTFVINNKPEKIYNVAIIGNGAHRDDVCFYSAGMEVYSEFAPHIFAIYNAENVLIENLTAGRTYWHPITVQGSAGAENVHFKNLHLVDAGEQFIKINNAEEPKCDNGIIEGCLIEYSEYPYWDGHYYTQGIDKIGGGDNWIVRDCIIKNIIPHPDHLADADGCGAPITFWQGGSNNLIERNTIINCRKGIELGISQGTGIDNSIVRNNMIYRDENIQGGDIGISVNDSPNAKIYNNTVILNGTFDPGSGAKCIEFRFPNSTDLEIKNNLCDGDIWVRTNDLNPDISSNIYDANKSWFIDADNYDLHLKSSAIDAIDKGITLEEVLDDFDKHPRPVNNIYDIGADELGSSESYVENSNTINNSFIVYPNPIIEEAKIIYEINYPTNVKIEIFNSLGNKVESLLNEYQDMGNYSINININKLPQGIYFIKLFINGNFESKKIVLLK